MMFHAALEEGFAMVWAHCHHEDWDTEPSNCDHCGDHTHHPPEFVTVILNVATQEHQVILGVRPPCQEDYMEIDDDDTLYF